MGRVVEQHPTVEGRHLDRRIDWCIVAGQGDADPLDESGHDALSEREHAGADQPRCGAAGASPTRRAHLSPTT